MANKEVHVGDDWYLDENNDGDLIVVNSNTGKVVKAIDKETGDEDKKGNSVNNVSSIPPKTNPNAVFPAGRALFNAEYVDEPFSSGWTDPMIFHRSNFDDEEYRVIVQDIDNDDVRLYRTSDFANYILIQQDIWGEHVVDGSNNWQDHIVLSDGKFVIYGNESGNNTKVWTGYDLTNLSLLGEVVSGYGDCGVFYDEENSTVHIYPEQSGGQSTDVMLHFTTPDDDLLNATQQSNMLDVSGKSWTTGDPDIIEFGNAYYAFIDNRGTHPQTDSGFYWIALFRSYDLYNWNMVVDKITDLNHNSGDMVLSWRDNHLEALTEKANIKHYWITPTQETTRLKGNSFTQFHDKDGGSGIYVRDGYRIMNDEGTYDGILLSIDYSGVKEMGILDHEIEFDDAGVIDLSQGNEFAIDLDGTRWTGMSLAIKESGQTEMQILPSKVLWEQGVTVALPERGADPSTSELDDGESTIYQSDGTADVTGDEGDVIGATNQGGTIKTKTLMDFSAL